MYSPLLNFLKNPNKESDFDKDLDIILLKIWIKGINPAFCKMSWEKFYITLSHEENPTSIAKKLLDAIEECKIPIKSINRVTDLNTQLSKEIDLFTSEGGRDEYLQAAYSYLDYKIRSDDDDVRCVNF